MTIEAKAAGAGIGGGGGAAEYDKRQSKDEIGDGWRSSQGDEFTDKSFYNSSNDGASSNYADYAQNEMPSVRSDRVNSKSNYSNGAKTMFDSFSLSNTLIPLQVDMVETAPNYVKPTIGETLKYCGGKLVHDSIFQTLTGVSIPAIPFSKQSAFEYGLIQRNIIVGSPKTNLYSIIGGNIGLKVGRSLFWGATKTTNVMRWFGRASPYYWGALGLYTVCYMGNCIHENRQ